MTTHTTWDGAPIATGAPQGSSVVVRRHTTSGWQYPILHRASKGTDYEGMWAWTPPSGMRQPGEAAYTAALRELAEETGITDLPIHPVDLARGHALWTATLGEHHTITLDHEHDRFEWLDADSAAKRCRPVVVAEAITTVEAIPDIDLAFRPVAPQDDMILVDGQCRGSAHHRPVTAQASLYEAVGHESGAVIDHEFTGTTHTPIGTEPRIIWQYLHDIVLPAHPEIHNVWTVIDPDDDETAGHYRKAGFTEDGVLDLNNDRRGRLLALRLAQWL